MRMLTSIFTESERQALLEYCGIDLIDGKDYSEDEVADIHEIVCDIFPYEYDDDGYPLELGWMFEHIIDKLAD